MRNDTRRGRHALGRALAGLLLWLLMAPARAQGPAWQAVTTAGQANGFSTATAMAADGSGNLYLAGSFSGTITFGTTALTSVGQTDVFVAKWNPGSQSFLWARQAGGANAEYAGGIAVDGPNIYLAGNYRSNPARFGGLSLPNGGNGLTDSDVFVAKLTDQGGSADFAWVQQLAGTGSDYATGLAVGSGGVYVAGYSNSPVLQAGAFALPTAGGYGVYVAKLTDTGPAGTVAWAQGMGGPGVDTAFGLAVAGGQVYVAGAFSNTAAFGPLSLTSAGAQDVFVTKLTDNGTGAAFAWAQRAGGPDTDWATSLALANGAVYVAGIYYSDPARFGGTALPYAGGTFSDVFVAKLPDNGTSAAFAWALGAGGTADDAPAALAVQGSSVLMTGYFTSPAIAFGPATLANPGPASEAFVARVVDGGAAAQFAWALRAGGPGQDTGQALLVRGSTVYVAGATNPPATFGPLTATTPAGTQAPYLAVLADAALAAGAPAAGAGFSVSPNPAHGRATVALPARAGGGPATLTLLDGLGRAVRRQVLRPAAAATTAELPLAGLPPGRYLLRLDTDTGPAHRALLVE